MRLNIHYHPSFLFISLVRRMWRSTVCPSLQSSSHFWLRWENRCKNHIATKRCALSLPVLNFLLLWCQLEQTNIGRAENIPTVPTNVMRIVVQKVTFQVEQSIDPKHVCIRILPPRLHTTSITHLAVKPHCKCIENIENNEYISFFYHCRKCW